MIAMHEKPAKQPLQSKSLLSEEVQAARALGLTYGKYKALSYTPSATPLKESSSETTAPKNRKRKYTDQQLFDLWQQGKTDAEIGKIIGVSRAMVQKWRDTMEIPSTLSKEEREAYCLIETKYGWYMVPKSEAENYI